MHISHLARQLFCWSSITCATWATYWPSSHSGCEGANAAVMLQLSWIQPICPTPLCGKLFTDWYILWFIASWITLISTGFWTEEAASYWVGPLVPLVQHFSRFVTCCPTSYCPHIGSTTEVMMRSFASYFHIGRPDTIQKMLARGSGLTGWLFQACKIFGALPAKLSLLLLLVILHFWPHGQVAGVWGTSNMSTCTTCPGGPSTTGWETLIIRWTLTGCSPWFQTLHCLWLAWRFNLRPSVHKAQPLSYSPSRWCTPFWSKAG